MEENTIKRERRKKLEKKKQINEMRSSLPTYTLEEIRSYRLPYYEALLYSLEEKGYLFANKYIKFLFNFQAQIRQNAGPASIVLLRPLLSESKSELELVSDGLIRAENYHNSGNFAQECQEVLQLAVHFAFSNDVWWWLGEQLLISNLILCRQSSDGFCEALTRYCYGKFLMENFRDDYAAIEHLNIARELSKGKEWSTKILFPSEPDILYLKANYLIYCCLIRQVERLVETDYAQAGKIAVLAKKRAAEACFYEGEIRALMLKGMCQLSSNDTKGAIESFTQSYYIQGRLGSQKGLCEARIHIAQAHLLDGDLQLSLGILLLLRESAEEHNLPYYLAQAYRHLGEFFLNNGEASKATPLLKESLKIFFEYNFAKECEQVRNLEAISIGLENFTGYVHLLVRSNDKRYINQLIDWKDSRQPFVTVSSNTRMYSIDDIIQASIAEVHGRRNASAELPEIPEEEATVVDNSINSGDEQ